MRPSTARLLPLLLLGFLVTGAWIERTVGHADLNIWITRDPIHVGDTPVDMFVDRIPEGVEVSREFSLSSLPERPLLVMSLHHVASSGTAAYRSGAFRDILELNGQEIATLNTLVPREKGPRYTVFVPIPAKSLKEGVNHLTLRAGFLLKDGKRIHDDLEWGPVRLIEGSRVRIRVEEGGKLVPARLRLMDPGGARQFSFGSLSEAAGSGDVIVTATGEVDVILPRGEPIEVWAFRGIEYTAPHTILVPSSLEETVTLEIRRVVKTPGWISGDFHLHAAPSSDSRVSLTDRVASLIAEGVEFAVATDHNKITDYAPAVADLGAGGWIVTAVGTEITTRQPRLGHFNAFPLDTSLPPVPFQDRTASSIFETARKEYGAEVVQVNHPRSRGMGYFGTFAFDRDTGHGGDGYSSEFNAVEVFNGGSLPDEKETILQDWYSILRHGHRVTATGNSDSHTIVFQDAGYPRNFVRVGKDDPSEISVKEVTDAVKAGRVIVSSGPFIDVSANGKGIGETATAPGGKVSLQITVQAAPWVEVGLVEVVVDGKVTHRVPVPATRDVERLRTTLDLQFEKHGFVVVLARGAKYRAPALTNEKVTPLAFTNPIWITLEKKSE
ncbi:MAG: CehA/McbA family metallohydrolase [Planctomycetota bacterium]|nr:CehA/McbA family metallohydrolase [Planctomycetota bacterium]